MRLHPYFRFSQPVVVEGRRNGVRLAGLALLGLATSIAASQARAANSQYFTSSVTTGSAYSWDSMIWSVAAGTSSGPFASAWTGGDFARFYGTGATNYTVTVGADELMAGMYLNVSAGATLTINQAGGTSGDLDVTPNGGVIAGNNTLAGPLQGFLIAGAGSSLIINAPITGAGGVDQQSSGSLALYGNNTYSGGTQVTGGQNTYYNNNNSFGTGSISVFGNNEAMLSNSATPVTIANNVVFQSAYAINLVGGTGSGSAAGTNFTGTFTLASTGTTTLNTSNAATTVDEISGAISGGSALTIADVGTMILAGANTYTGTTTVSGTATLKLGAANTIASSTSLVLNGGTLNPDGISQSMTATTLGLASSSIIDFGAGASTLSFANSSGLTWTGTLNLTNYTAGLDALQFGSGTTGLTAAELKDIEFNGAGLGTATLDANGFVIQASSAAPEPAGWALLGSGVLGAGVRMVCKFRTRKTKSRAA